MATSPAFSEGGPIPQRCAGRGIVKDLSPELHWTGIPEGTGQLILLLDDADAPLRKPLMHSAAALDPTLPGLAEGTLKAGTPGVRIVPTLLSKDGYSGPRPIPGHGPHRYRFYVLALGTHLPDVVLGSVKSLLSAVAGQVLARGTLTGVYER